MTTPTSGGEFRKGLPNIHQEKAKGKSQDDKTTSKTSQVSQKLGEKLSNIKPGKELKSKVLDQKDQKLLAEIKKHLKDKGNINDYFEKNIPKDQLSRVLEKIDPMEVGEEDEILFWALENDDEELLRARATHPKKRAQDVQYALLGAVDEGKKDIVEILLKEAKADPWKDDAYALFPALENQDSEIVELALTLHEGGTPMQRLMFAAGLGKPDLVDQILKSITEDSNKEEIIKGAFNTATQFAHVDVMKMLMTKYNADPSMEDNTLLQTAVMGGELKGAVLSEKNIKVVELLSSDKRVDPKSALEAAKEKGDEEVIKLLEDAIKNREK